MTQLNALRLAKSLETIIHNFELTGAQNFDLPSVAKAGQAVLVYNDTTNGSILTIRSSNTNSVETIRWGYCLVVAKQDNPTTSAHWRVIEVYEEGTWTPTVSGSSGAFSAVTYIAQQGTFTRFNKRLFFECRVGWSAATGGTGSLQISSLPYACGSVVGATVDARYSVYFNNLDLSAGYTQVNGNIANGQTDIALVNSGDNLVGAAIPVAAGNSGTFSKNLNTSGSYPLA